jgi:hypothetical protein
MNKQKLAAILMLVSGCTHPSQLLIYGSDDPDLLRSSLMGMVFLLVGACLLSARRWALWVGIIIPLVFGLGASYRIATQAVTPFSYAHTLVDFIVVILCVLALLEADNNTQAAG